MLTIVVDFLLYFVENESDDSCEGLRLLGQKVEMRMLCG